MSEIGYCTLEDVRKALQETDLAFDDAELSHEFVKPAILGQTEWLQETTNRHWFEPGGTDGGEGDLLPTDPLTHSHDALDIPSSPHADHAQMQSAAARGRRYPVRHAGPYTRVLLSRRDVRDVTELLVRDNTGGVTDWVENKDEGRGDDYYLQVDDANGATRLYLHTRSLPTLNDYGAAVTATYEYGIEGITQTVRRAIAFRAAAELLRDDESAIGLPDSGQLVQLDTKADAMEQKAEELLDIHL